MGKKDYTKIINEVGKNEFESRLRELSDTIDSFLNEAGYPDYYICNDRILYHVVLDYFTDIIRLKDFHDIEHTKKDKIIAYKINWLLRRKPIQITEFSEEETDIFVNERFACNLLIGECLMDNNNPMLSGESAVKFGKYIDMLLYYFIYRPYNAKVIEMLIESFRIGQEFPVLNETSVT